MLQCHNLGTRIVHAPEAVLYLQPFSLLPDHGETLALESVDVLDAGSMHVVG